VTLPRCRAQDLKFLDAHSEPAANLVLLKFANVSDHACALVSYPALFGRAADGTWAEIATLHQAQDPVTAGPWTGEFVPTTFGVGAPPVLFRLQTVPSSETGGPQCPGGANVPANISV